MYVKEKMNEKVNPNSLNNLNNKASSFGIVTIRNILKLLAFFCFVFSFFPAFTVSCSANQIPACKITIKAINMLTGKIKLPSSFLWFLQDDSLDYLGDSLEDYANYLPNTAEEFASELQKGNLCLSDSNFIAVFFFLLPIAVILLLFCREIFKKFLKKDISDTAIKAAAIGCAAVNLILWIIGAVSINSSITEMKEQLSMFAAIGSLFDSAINLQIKFKITIWYILTVFFLLIIIAGCVMSLLNIIDLDKDLIAPSSQGKFQSIPQPTPPHNHPNSDFRPFPSPNHPSNHAPSSDTPAAHAPTPKPAVTTAYSPKQGQLKFTKGELAGTNLVLPSNHSIVIGRDPASANIILNTPDISRRHCEIQFDAAQNRYYICDYSSYGTFIAEKRLPKNTPVPCTLGTKLSLASGKNEILLS